MYDSKIDLKKYISTENLMSTSDNLNSYNTSYTENTFTDNLYSNIMRSISGGSHLGKYAPLK